MPTVVDLASLDAQGFAVAGDNAGDRAGWSVSDAGDVNGDGFADIIIGAPLNDDGGDNAGKAYVIYGGGDGFGAIDLGNLQLSDGFAIQGDQNDLAGFSVSGAGDVNGDGFDDVIVGATIYGFYGSITETYVIFGKASSPGTIDLSNLASSDGAIFVGDYTYDGYYGGGRVSVSAAGDINGDGFDDIVIGLPYENYGTGATYVVFGKSEFTGFELPGVSPPDGFEIAGDTSFYGLAGFSVSGAGDFNGDGFDDLIIGAPFGDNGGDNAGQAYVIFGKASGFGTIDLSSLAADAGFVIQGDEADDRAGWSVSAAGDVNGDGLDDLIIGAPYGGSGGTRSGEAYVIFGKASGFGTIDLTNLAPAAGFLIQGDETGDRAGWSVSAAGDVNNDGFADILVGAPDNNNTGGINAGEAYVIFGKATGFGTIDLTNLAPSDGVLVQGDEANDKAGWSVSGAGDVDGDGFDDLLIGAPYSDGAGNESGAAYIVSGALHLRAAPRPLPSSGDFNGDGRGDILWRNDDGTVIDWLGRTDGGFADNAANSSIQVSAAWQVAGFGDFDGDGRDDVLWRNADGRVIDWLGKEDGDFANNPNGNFDVSNSWQVAGFGDFNGDGRDDILWRNADGSVISWHGKADGDFANNPNGNFDVSNSWQVAAVGDFNGDGRDDVLWRNDDGSVISWHGKEDGDFANNANGNYIVSDSWQVAGVGDFDGDGLDDILWRNDDGRVIDWLGQADGSFGDNPNGNYIVSDSWQVAGVGDFNGDNRDDIFWRNDDGRVIDWLGRADGSFGNNPNGNYIVSNSWQVQPPGLM